MFLSLYLVVKVARTGWVEKNGHEFWKTKVASCCNMLPGVAICCHMLPTVSTCCQLWQHVANSFHMFLTVATCCQLLPHVASCCQLLPPVACLFLSLYLGIKVTRPVGSKKTDMSFGKPRLPGLLGVCLFVSQFIFGSQGCQDRLGRKKRT